MPSSVAVGPARRIATDAPPLPGDKSISHRALILGALARGTTRVRRCAPGADVASTASALRALGNEIARDGDDLVVAGGAWHPPASPLDCGNSGTTMRLLAGALAGRGVVAVLDGDASLRRRPMRRVTEPLRVLGAEVETSSGGTAPLRVAPSAPLRGRDVRVDVASAQVVTALVLAALGASGTTRVRGGLDGRDHTQRILPRFGARILRDGDALVVSGGQTLTPADIEVPGDPSAAAYWLAAAAIVPGARVVVRDVSLNPTRLGFVRALARMGAEVDATVERDDGEPVGTIELRARPLCATTVDAHEVPSLVDELPLLGALAAYAEGTTIVRGAGELRVKESDRIAGLVAGLRALGVQADDEPAGFSVTGAGARGVRGGATLDACGDHRLAMTFAVLAVGAASPLEIVGADAVAISHPSFFEDLREFAGA